MPNDKLRQSLNICFAVAQPVVAALTQLEITGPSIGEQGRGGSAQGAHGSSDVLDRGLSEMATAVVGAALGQLPARCASLVAPRPV